MKKAVVIGGAGKVGGYLSPMLAEAGYRVFSVSRGRTKPKVQHDAWQDIEQVTLDRASPDFARGIAALEADVVVDMICFKLSDMRVLAEALRGKVGHYLLCGSAWMHGHSARVPVREEECREPLEEYGTQKSLMDYELTRLYKEENFPGTAVHPGHIVCPGDEPINPQGFKGLSTFGLLKEGKKVILPNFGMETVHHVHAKDVAGVFFAAIESGKISFGEGFHAVSPRAVTLRGYAIEAASWFGKEPSLAFEPFDRWKEHFTPAQGSATLTHILHAPGCSMQKAKDLLNFTPQYTSFEAVRECVRSFGMLP